MASASPLVDLAPAPVRTSAQHSRFYVWISLLFLFIAVGGFVPTYWAQLPAGTLNGTPLMHVHAVLFTAWPLLLVSQAVLIARGGLRHHRVWGLAGISLASMMLIVGLMTAVVALQDRLAAGDGDPARSFLIVPFTAIGLFFAFFAAAVANVSRPEWHKRFIVIATTSVLTAAMARFFFFAANGMAAGLRPGALPPAPVSRTLGPMALLDLIIVGAMIWDKRRNGKVHPAWNWGLAILIPIQLLRAPVSQTQAWLAFADWMTRFV